MIKAYLKFFSCYVSQKLIEILVKLIQNHKPFHLNRLYALATNFLLSPIKTEKKEAFKKGNLDNYKGICQLWSKD
jgi:hypothetical protein